MSKKAFEDLSRNSIYVADPIAQLRIIGGLSLPPEEQGELDTELDKAHPLYDERLRVALAAPFIANINHYGIKTPILIAKIDDVPTVVAGRRRVRAARLINRQRLERGEPTFSVECKIQRATDPATLIGVMISENEARSPDDFQTKLAKAIRLLDQTGSEEATARALNITQATLTGWLAFDANATDVVKRATAEGRVSASAAATLAKIKDPDEQNAALETLLSTPDKPVSARRARQVVAGDAGTFNPTGKRDLAKLLASIQATDRRTTSEATLGYWQGVEAALELALGKGVDDRLTAAIAKLAKAE